MASAAENQPVSDKKAIKFQEPENESENELKSRFDHLKRVSLGESRAHFKTIKQVENFAEVYDEFEDFFSRAQLRALEKIFISSDHDNDKFLSFFEMKYFLEKRGTPVSQAEAKRQLFEADEDHDGKLNFREFLLLCKRIELSTLPEEPSDALKKERLESYGQSLYQDAIKGDEEEEKLKTLGRVKPDIQNHVKFFEERFGSSESSHKSMKKHPSVSRAPIEATIKEVSKECEEERSISDIVERTLPLAPKAKQDCVQPRHLPLGDNYNYYDTETESEFEFHYAPKVITGVSLHSLSSLNSSSTKCKKSWSSWNIPKLQLEEFSIRRKSKSAVKLEKRLSKIFKIDI